jgi:hypothetical protein
MKANMLTAGIFEYLESLGPKVRR